MIQSSVKASLTYLCDLVVGSCPALTTINPTPSGPDISPPHVSLVGQPVWDFNTAGFQAFAAPGNDIIDTKYMDFKAKYPSVRINVVDFQHAAFCLAGMLTTDLISFLYEGQNDRDYFRRGPTSVKEAKFVAPLRTAKGWTPDCFIARFERYSNIYTKDTYAQIPNPTHWLQAEMDYEAQRGRAKLPWFVDAEAENDSVVSWELLRVMQFDTRGDSKQYPKSLIPKVKLLS